MKHFFAGVIRTLQSVRARVTHGERFQRPAWAGLYIKFQLCTEAAEAYMVEVRDGGGAFYDFILRFL